MSVAARAKRSITRLEARARAAYIAKEWSHEFMKGYVHALEDVGKVVESDVAALVQIEVEQARVKYAHAPATKKGSLETERVIRIAKEPNFEEAGLRDRLRHLGLLLRRLIA